MSNAAIYYTTDGSTPTSNSALYTGPIHLSGSQTVKAVASANSYPLSGVTTAVYVILPPAATPEFSVPAGTYTSAQSVALSDSTSGATIYYTTDGSVPTKNSRVYRAPISISATTKIEALALAPTLN
jgi:hypothetical protein